MSVIFDVILDAEHENHDHDMEYLHGHDHQHTHDHEHVHEDGSVHTHEHHHHDHSHEHHHDHGHHHEHRGLHEILHIIEHADMTERAKRTAVCIFPDTCGSGIKGTRRTCRSGTFS